VLVISVGLAFWLGGQGGLARITPAPAAAAPATTGAPPPATTGAPPPATTAATPGGATSTSAQTACSPVQTIGRGLDLGAPFLPVAPAVAGSCQPTASPVGDALTITRWVLQLAAWALAALFIAGFTGIVRKI
jgi:hypothetical protein